MMQCAMELSAFVAASAITYVVAFAFGVMYGERRCKATIEYVLRGGDWTWRDGKFVRSEKRG